MAQEGNLDISVRTPLGSEPTAFLPPILAVSQPVGMSPLVASAPLVRMGTTTSGLKGKLRIPALGQKLLALALGIAVYQRDDTGEPLHLLEPQFPPL